MVVVNVASAATQTVTTLMAFYGSLAHYWLRGGPYADCPFFQHDLHARTYVYSIALLQTLWAEPHYRNPTFYDDLLKNLRDVAIPGTGVPLSLVASSRLFLYPFLLFVYPWLCAIGAFWELNQPCSYQDGSFATRFLRTFSQILVNPQSWFSFWRINCHLSSLHSWKTQSKDYLMENKWDFLVESDKHGIAVSPYLKAPASLVIKDRNEEGGLGIFFFKNAVHGGDWIIQEKLDNSPFLKTLLPENAPLSTFRIITASRYGLGLSETELKGKDGVKSLSCVFRAGLKDASTDHKSIMFDVDMETGKIAKGSTTMHWYRVGPQHVMRGKLSIGHDITNHPDTGVPITGNVVKEIKQMKKLVEEAHFKLMKDVPLCGWDVALTNKGVLLLEVNISCNFFRGTFDQPWYFKFLDEYFRHLETLPAPKGNKKSEFHSAQTGRAELDVRANGSRSTRPAANTHALGNTTHLQHEGEQLSTFSGLLPTNQRQVCSAWGELDPVLAVALENREIHFFSDEGEKNAGSPVYSRQADIVTMSCQPRGGALAVGWSDGMVSLWVFKEGASREVNSPHTGRISLLKWAPAGNRLMSADENGVFVVWKVDSRSQLSLGTQYNRQGSMTHCVFATSSTPREKAKGDTFVQHVCPSFFFGGEIGSVHYADDLGHISDIQVLNHAIDAMMFFEEKNRLIVITRALQLNVFQVATQEGTVKPTMKVKLSIAGDGSLRETKWAGPGLLAIASGEPLIRFWDLQAEENSVLSLPKTSATTNPLVSTIDFSPRKRILVAGTAQGMVYFWRCTTLIEGSKGAAVFSHRWDLIFMTDIGRSLNKIGWSALQSMLYANTAEGVVIFHEGNMQRVLCGDTAVIQHRPMALSVEKFRDGIITQSTLDAGLRIKGISHDGLSLVLWNGSKAEVYELRDSDIKRLSQFKCSSTAMVLRGDSIYRTNGNHVEICNTQGVVKNSISFTEAEGKAALLAINNKFLVVGTDRGLVRVFDLSRREPKATGSMGNFPESFGDDTKGSMMRSIAVNADGTRVCILAERLEGALRMRTPLNKLFLFQTDLNIFQQYDFGLNRYPMSVFFDPQEPRLLVCETFKSKTDNPSQSSADSRKDGVDDGTSGSGSGGGRSNVISEKEITIMFASNDHGLLMQDSFDLETKYSALLGIQVPRIYLIAQIEKPNEVASSSSMSRSNQDDSFSYLKPRVMRDFIGLDKVNETARQALIDFCYFMTIGNMDEAYRSVKLIENPSVWENMAHMCVKTKRLDVAEVCLGNMGHARGAAAVQEAKKEPQPEVAIAMVAIQLGLLDDAARLYRECGRYDLLNKLYQASGYWQKAADIAAKRDRIHLKNTLYVLARHYEELGEIKEAMEAYADAGTHQKDIPRMLFKLGKIDLLQKYISQSKDRDLWIWWAQFQESQGHFDLAIESYERAKDFLSVVRVLCFKKDFQAAAKVVQASGNRAAAYHLARQFEAHGDIQTAIHFFANGGCYNHAIRLAKEHRMDSDLMTFALQSKPADMLECAAYFEERREMEKAVQLYHKGGNVARALDLCFQAQLFEELHHLTDELGPNNTAPAILKKCIDFFIANGHYAKAVHLCLVGNRMVEALEICMQHKVKVTEEMAEKMTPPKDDKDSGDKIAQKKRTELLLKLAKCCKQQGAYHLATKKYTQAGDKLKAMKCLLKSGDTEKVVFFANVSRNNEIYVLAANYLQNLNWRSDNEILKSIVGFYSKARAFEQLAAFYTACAQVEIEEYRDYDKAIGALQEAIKVLAKVKSENKEQLVQSYQHRVQLMEQFVQARQLMKSNVSEMVALVTQLLEAPGIEEAVRVGDAYAMLVEAYYQDAEYDKCMEMMEEMKRRGLMLKSYVDSRVIMEVHQKLGIQLSGGADDKRRRPSLRGDAKDIRAEDFDAKGESKSRAPTPPSPRPSASSGREGGDDDDDLEEDIQEAD
ncbi:TPA: LOW QUALITY PROTEIN: hypothetical protein N0F65_001787 [Lagenidium giganteum]|uniref:Intraflagellar transport protein 140 n=1 Tax=Lagenidium giganteum TaxID=4803 RepID=A0AAV2Z3P1_9STRA|nr:TPA: LOW QUALITY PROTEIN: hypothetical protein N0F65_001787 [Lagenidium giganteum]